MTCVKEIDVLNNKQPKEKRKILSETPSKDNNFGQKYLKSQEGRKRNYGLEEIEVGRLFRDHDSPL